jgi:Baseplate J-like protein
VPDQFIQAPIETDPSALADDAKADFAVRLPGWQDNPAAPESIIVEEVAQMAAEERDVASDVPAAIFRFYGAKLQNLPPISAASATVHATVTAKNNAGYTIHQGDTLGLRSAGDELVLFDVVTDVTIPPGSTATAAGAVTLESQDQTADANNLSGTFEIIDAGLDWIATAVTTDTSSSGADDEDDDTYLNRLAAVLALQSPRPILPNDFAVLYRESFTDVFRATALDGYNPADGTSGNARMVTVVGAQQNGSNVSSGTKTAAAALLTGMREANFIVNVADPTTTQVDVSFAAVKFSQFDPQDVHDRAVSALQAFLDPGTWGVPPFGEAPLWINQPKVLYQDISAVLNAVDGLDHWTTLQIALHGAALGTADLTLPGVAPLAAAGTITGTVT